MSPKGISSPDSLVLADALPANAKDIPAAPNSGTVLLPRFRFGACFPSNILEFSNVLYDRLLNHRAANVFRCNENCMALSLCTILSAF
jgi:hypothetical protein